MSEPTQSKSSPGSTIATIFIGIVVMVAGMFIQNNHLLAAIDEPVSKMGIPLEIGMSIATIGVFLILFKVIESFFFNPLRQAIDGRTTELETTFGEAESLRADMTKMKSDYESKLKQTEADAREQIQAQIKEATDLKKSLMADAQRQAEDYKQQAMNEIDAEKRKAMVDLRVHVTKLSLQATEKILGENVDNDRNRKLIDEFLNTVEVKN